MTNTYTEKEASQMRCAGPVSDVRGSLCVGSQCLAWRWHVALSVDNPTHTTGAGQTITAARGYCGLAGKP